MSMYELKQHKYCKEIMDDSDFCSSEESSPYEENNDRRIVKYRKADIKDVNIRDSVLASFGHLLKVRTLETAISVVESKSVINTI